jgi:TRAP transporter TAXI family solute receptor
MVKKVGSHMKLFSKKALVVVSMCIATAIGVAGCGGSGGSSDSGAKKFVNIATGGTAGTYYPLGGAIAEILNKAIPNMNASAQSTGATVANINMLKDGSVDMAIVQNDIVYYAANGLEMFKDKKVTNLRGIASLYPETVQIVTLAGSNITSVDQLRGKRVAVGAAGSGAEANARQILEAYGLTYNDINPQYLSFGEAASALKDNNIDVAFVTAGAPTAAIQDIAASNKVALVPLAGDKVDQLIQKYPYYAKQTIPAGTYAGIDNPIDGVAVKAVLVVSDKVDDSLGYEITKSIFSNLDRLTAAHAVGKLIQKATATEAMPIPLNPGAEKFYNEK